MLIGGAQVEDLGGPYFLGAPRIEELLELSGALLWFCFGLGMAGEAEEPAEQAGH